MPKYLDLLFNLLLIIIFFEIFFNVLINYIKKDFQWIITNKDEFPFNSKKDFEKFLKQNYNFNTGWDRQKKTKGYEKIGKKITKFEILNEGFRNTNLKKKKSYISVFGDSYAFSRFVNNDETWESILENKINSCVRNYGVGNFGLDQSFLKFKRTKLSKNNKIIVFAFVPETISRINSYWKHYCEFGNKYGFKPFYKLDKDKLVLNRLLINKKTNFENLRNKISEIKKKDIFYERRFKYYMFSFPYIVSYVKSFSRNNVILYNMMIYKIYNIFNIEKKEYYFKCFNRIVKDNIYDANKMYNELYFKTHLRKLMMLINDNIKKKKKNCVFLIMPQLHDLYLIKKNLPNYQNFYHEMSKKNKLNILDLTNSFLNLKNFSKVYLEDKYGGHLNKRGNTFVANQFYRYIKMKKFL